MILCSLVQKVRRECSFKGAFERRAFSFILLNSEEGTLLLLNSVQGTPRILGSISIGNS